MANSLFTPTRTWGPFPSSSGGKDYTVQLNTTGIISCNCKGWTMYKGRPRSCKHTDRVIRSEGLLVQPNGQYFFVVDQRLAQAKQVMARTPQEKFSLLLAEYEAAVNYMASLPPNQILAAAAKAEEAKFKLDAYILMLEAQGIQINA